MEHSRFDVTAHSHAVDNTICRLPSIRYMREIGVMSPFRITVDGKTETFAPDADFADGEQRQHWTLAGLDKLIQLGLWERRLDRRGTVLERPPTVEHVRRLSEPALG